MIDTLLGMPLVAVDKVTGGGDIKLGTFDAYMICEHCGRSLAEHTSGNVTGDDDD